MPKDSPEKQTPANHKISCVASVQQLENVALTLFKKRKKKQKTPSQMQCHICKSVLEVKKKKNPQLSSMLASERT